ncbi:GNAT family N-acetyltransferase [Mesobacillus zeae]|uniref:N-acetyltransferase n=1 Tax=Mesobacillus zeae TaxID=1917180 RepID=A0A398BDB4_9BACI|nr:GNAT family protein [Mesobacillus zeae]RID85750.1 N-acetyltransferase [Mesobacillus zeae]
MTKIPENMISLSYYRPEYQSSFETYSLSQEQREFTAMPLGALAVCETSDDRHPIVILYKNELAGFFVLHGWEGVKHYSDNRHAILLRAYSVNEVYQGKGIAKESIRQLPAFVKENFPDKNEIILGVNRNNKAAQHVYQRGGFRDKGIRYMGEKGEQLVLHMDLV